MGKQAIDISPKESPFTPGRPVPVEYFVARHKEIERFHRAIRQTASGRNENLFITGKRGIGKSSLAEFMQYVAEKEYSFVGTHCHLSGVKSLEEMAAVVFEQLLEDCTDRALFDKLKSLFAQYIKGITLFGVNVEFTKDKAEQESLLRNFLPALRKVHESIAENGHKALMLVLDDLNGITDLPEFAHFLKSFVDGLATSRRPFPLLLILVGTPERRYDIVRHNESVARIFDIIELLPMNRDESKEFFSTVFGRQKITVDAKAMDYMVKFSAGYPMLMHEIGDAVFWQDVDANISESDAKRGIMEAARTVGHKYIDPQVVKVLKSKIYASILWKLGKKLPLGAAFERKSLLKEVGEREQKNLDNFLKKMRTLGIIDDAEVRGEYKFVNPLYHLYLWYEAKEQEQPNS
jgi:hypothetical protein